MRRPPILCYRLTSSVASLLLHAASNSFVARLPERRSHSVNLTLTLDIRHGLVSPTVSLGASMKRIAFTLASLILAAMMFTGVLLASKRRQKADMRFNVKDLPEHGLRIIDPTNPSFDAMASEHAAGVLSRTFSVFINNSGQRAVVAYKIKWELLRSDGRILTHTESFAEPGLLMGRALSAEANPQSDDGGYALRPNTSRLVSWATPMAQESAPAPSQETDEALKQLSTHLLSATALTVSIDGVFFEDGTFVGENTTGYFEQIEAQVKARRDLIDSLALAARGHSATDDVLLSIERAGEAEDVRVNYDSTPTDFYNLYKKIYARELTGIRRAYGKEKAVAHALELHKKAWPRLKKE